MFLKEFVNLENNTLIFYLEFKEIEEKTIFKC